MGVPGAEGVDRPSTSTAKADSVRADEHSRRDTSPPVSEGPPLGKYSKGDAKAFAKAWGQGNVEAAKQVLALEGDKHVSLFFPPSACLALEYIALGLKPPLFLDAAQAANKELEVLKEQLTLRVETLEAQHNSSAEALSALEDTSELRAKLAATQQQLDDMKAMLTRLQGQFALHHDTLKTTQLAVGAASVKGWLASCWGLR